MNWLVIESLLPVVLMIAAGGVAGRCGWIREAALKDLAQLTFLLFSPALLFRSMSQVRLEQLDFVPVMVYLGAAALLFVGTLGVSGLHRRGVLMALAGTFSNTVMVGIALVHLLFGEPGLVILLTLVSVHALVLLSAATLVLEWVVQREQAQESAGLLKTIGRVLKSTLLHPVPLPILLGLAYAQTGWGIPAWIDKPLGLLAQAFSPLALVLVGATLACTSVGRHWRGALLLTGVKNLLHPLLTWGLCRLLGVGGLPMTVMVAAAALPMGSNVFLFSQRYGVAQELVTASVLVSTCLALLTLTAVLILLT
jgi:malonate transporter